MFFPWKSRLYQLATALIKQFIHIFFDYYQFVVRIEYNSFAQINYSFWISAYYCDDAYIVQCYKQEF